MRSGTQNSRFDDIESFSLPIIERVVELVGIKSNLDQIGQNNVCSGDMVRIGRFGYQSTEITVARRAAPASKVLVCHRDGIRLTHVVTVDIVLTEVGRKFGEYLMS